MCGITGILQLARSYSRDDLRVVARAMSARLAHRGPDGFGVWVDADAEIALGHRRLAIIDLSENGRQPMVSESGRYVLSLNGEIYNFRELRQELETKGHVFRGSSDTEALLAAFEEWGIDESLPKINGMFALAVWDRWRRNLTLARDRIGEKPLYYAVCSKNFIFASELKALRSHPEFDAPLNRDVLAAYLRHNFVPCPYSIYHGVFKVPAGHSLNVSATTGLQESKPYWMLRTTIESAKMLPFVGSTEDAIAELERLLRQAVRRQMVSDVPLGAFLSGGIDSSTIVALMQSQSARAVKTFTVGFHDQQYDEARFARAVAEALGTEHAELYVTEDQAMEVIPRLPEMYDEPFADSSQIPTYLVAKLARESVTVSLSGDAGDELFGGYYVYGAVRRLWQWMRLCPAWIRELLQRTLRAGQAESWIQCLVRMPFGTQRIKGNSLHKFASILDAESVEDVFERFTAHRQRELEWVSDSRELEKSSLYKSSSRLSDVAERMMYIDMLSYLPDDILVKLDRAAMSVGLETRVPMLDCEVVNFAWRLPMSLKVRDGKGKWILRQVLKKYVPPALVERPKMGFSIPLSKWLRGPLRDWAEHMMEENRLRQDGYLNAKLVRQMWIEHLSGKRDWHAAIWDIVMFQSWLQGQRSQQETFPELERPLNTVLLRN